MRIFRVYNNYRMNRTLLAFALAAPLFAVSGCGYHTLGAATHLPPSVHTLAVPVFTTRTELNRTETVMTQAVIREFATRTRLRVTPDATRPGRRAEGDDPQGDGCAAYL